MIQPKRYSLVSSYYCSDAKMEAFEDGEFVRHADYAALLAENERLRKAGDALVEIVHGTYCVTPPQALIDWHAAKETRP